MQAFKAIVLCYTLKVGALSKLCTAIQRYTAQYPAHLQCCDANKCLSLQAALEKDSELRPSAKELLKYPFVDEPQRLRRYSGVLQALFSLIEMFWGALLGWSLLEDHKLGGPVTCLRGTNL